VLVVFTDALVKGLVDALSRLVLKSDSDIVDDEIESDREDEVEMWKDDEKRFGSDGFGKMTCGMTSLLADGNACHLPLDNQIANSDGTGTVVVVFSNQFQTTDI